MNNEVDKPSRSMFYNAPTVGLHRTTLVVLGFLVAVFVALYPYLGSMEMCDSAECPLVVHSASGGFSAACLVAVLSAAPAVRAVGRLKLRGIASGPRPVQVCSSPDSPPPRIA